jgi:outer membrane protein OmpA-like peptidoglycan-associated protein
MNPTKPSKEELKIMQATISNKIEQFEPIEFTTISEEEKVIHYFVYFDSDKSLIKSEYKVELDRLVIDLKKMGSYKVLVYGHTDSDGDSMYNIYLGNARAKQVMSYLVENGISLENIDTFTYGKTSPIVANTTEALKAKNRRAEILIIRK